MVLALGPSGDCHEVAQGGGSGMVAAVGPFGGTRLFSRALFLDMATRAKNIHKYGQRSEVLPYLEISICSYIGPMFFHYLRVPMARRRRLWHFPYVKKENRTSNWSCAAAQRSPSGPPFSDASR